MGHLRDLTLRARSFLRPPTHKLRRLNPDLGYWGGVTWVYDVTLTQGAGGGEAILNVVPGEGNEMELQSIMMDNRSVAAVLVRAGIATQFKALGEGVFDNLTEFILIDGALGASAVEHWPQNYQASDDNLPTAGGSRRFIAGGMSVWMQVATLPLSRPFRFVIVARVRGDKPTTTPETSGGSGFTFVVNKDRFF